MRALDRRPRTFLSRLHDYYHLDGEMPPNLRILRQERLAADLRAALAEIGMRLDREPPWLNRSRHGDARAYYDPETEALIYERNRWLFERGWYDRLDLAAGGSGG